MKTFKQFLEEASNVIQTFRKSGHKLEKGGYKDKDDPSNMLNYGWIIKKAKRRDLTPKEMDKYQKGIYDKYKQITNPVKPA